MGYIASRAAGLAMAGLGLALAAPGLAQEARFDVLAFQVKGNRLLPPDAVERVVYPYMGPGRTADDIEAARAALQKAYEDAGFIAVSVFIPEQGVESGVLLLEVSEQTIGKVEVTGTKSPEKILAKAKSLEAGKTPNLPEFQKDVVALNQTASRRVTPELKAGEAPGTLDVVLTVEETSPFSASVEVNNFASASTSEYRTSLTVGHDNLWGAGHSVNLSAQTAPERADDGTVYSINYMMPLGAGTQLLGYYVRSDSDIAIVGGMSVVGRGNMGGVRLIRSLGSRDGFYHSLTAGIDWKDFEETVTLGSDRTGAPIEYYPLSLSWRGDWTGEHRSQNLSITSVMGVRGLGSSAAAFDYKRYNARPSFLVLKAEAERTDEVGANLQMNLRLSGQWSADPLISNEQFSLGGMSSVRGYFESEAMGDYGAAMQAELRSPRLWTSIGAIDEFRVHGFWDAGFAGIHDPLTFPTRQKDSYLLMSAGIGARIRLLKHLNGDVDVGAPLITEEGSKTDSVFLRFRIWGEF